MEHLHSIDQTEHTIRHHPLQHKLLRYQAPIKQFVQVRSITRRLRGRASASQSRTPDVVDAADDIRRYDASDALVRLRVTMTETMVSRDVVGLRHVMRLMKLKDRFGRSIYGLIRFVLMNSLLS